MGLRKAATVYWDDTTDAIHILTEDHVVSFDKIHLGLALRKECLKFMAHVHNEMLLHDLGPILVDDEFERKTLKVLVEKLDDQDKNLSETTDIPSLMEAMAPVEKPE